MGVEIIKCLKKILKGVSTLQGVVFNHHTRHEAGGGDEIATLVGVHHTTHENGGGDEINVAGLSGVLADLQNPFLTQGTHANRPAAGVQGRLYFETDTGICYRDNGTTWQERWRLETATRLAQLAEKAHSSLAGVTASQHHTKTSKLSEITIDADKNWAGKAINSPGNVDGVDISEFVKGFNAKARAWRNGLQNISTDTITIVQLGNESYDPGGNFSTATYRLTAPYSGYYGFSTMAIFAHNHPNNQLPADKTYQVFLFKNGSTRLLNAGSHSSWGGAVGCAGSDKYYLAANDYMDMRVWHNGGITIELWGEQHSTYMAAHLLSKA